MAGHRSRGQSVRKYILDNVEQHATDISKKTSNHFKISRQAAYKYIKKLVTEEALTESGTTRAKSYKLRPFLEWENSYSLGLHLEEHIIWTKDVLPLLGTMPKNISDIWLYGFTEMFNNAIDHSGGTSISIYVTKTSFNTEIIISDNGVGIFKKIQSALNLFDERLAIFELSKGKLTTDPIHHTGEGIFFTSRVFDGFVIHSGSLIFSHNFGDHHDLLSDWDRTNNGTVVWMKLNNHAERTLLDTFNEYQSSDNEYQFNKTVIRLKLAQLGTENLMSRSQAKRVLARVELFQVVTLDFADIEFIGQAFADEIFRVFSRAHPQIKLQYINTNPDVKQMIERALHNKIG